MHQHQGKKEEEQVDELLVVGADACTESALRVVEFRYPLQTCAWFSWSLFSG